MEDAGFASLPPDIVEAIFGRVELSDLVRNVPRVCQMFRAAASADAVWKQRMRETYSRLLSEVFDGTLPPPPATSTKNSCAWREHFFSFATNFMSLAGEAPYNRLVLQIDGMIYDVTSYLDQHPGAPEVLSAAAGHDASAVFLAVGHSNNARRLLAELAIAPRDDLVPPECDSLRGLVWSTECGGTGGALPVGAETWTQFAGAVVGNLRSGEGRSRLKQMFRMSMHALLHDLTEGRPDCRRLMPAIRVLTSVTLLQPHVASPSPSKSAGAGASQDAQGSRISRGILS